MVDFCSGVKIPARDSELWYSIPPPYWMKLISRTVGTDEAEAEYAAFRPTSVVVVGERLLPGE